MAQSLSRVNKRKGIAKKIDTRFPADLLRKIKELHSIISKANELAISGQAAIKALQERERELSTLMSNLPGMVFRILNDEEWTILFVSEGCLELTGYRPSDLAEKRPSYASIVHPEDRDRLRSATKRGLMNRERIREEYRIITASGEVKWVWEQSIGIYSEQGEVLAIEGFVTDITEQVRTRKALQRSEQELKTLSLRLMNVQENERKRISRELHDGIGQLLGAINISVQTAIKQLDQGLVTESKKTLEAMVPAIQVMAEEVSTICNHLRPPFLDEIGIIAAISWLCRSFEEMFSIGVQIRLDVEEEDVPEDLKIVIYRVLQESLNNIGKHSHSDMAWVSLVKHKGRIVLSIEDRGVGLRSDFRDPRKPHGKGLGIASMKERVENTGGSFVIRSAHRSGTIIQASWPVR